MFFVTLIVFIFILGILIFVHEFGHFLVAKKSGVEVEEFAFGFPPRLFCIKKGETNYCINLIPLGGYVKMVGEEGQEMKNPRSFARKKIWNRALILSAGVVMNFLFAGILLSFGFGFGMLPLPIMGTAKDFQQAKVETKVVIAQVVSGSPAALASLKEGDVIEAVGDAFRTSPLTRVEDMPAFTKAHAGKEVQIVIEREGVRQTKTITLLREAQPEQGYLGVEVQEVITRVQYPWWQAPVVGFYFAGKMVVATILLLYEALRNLIVSRQVPQDIAGPVGIFLIVGQAIPRGISYILQLTAIISVNLAVINVLPFPALDGGRLLFVAIEKIRGRKVAATVEAVIHNIGFILLMLLVALITFYDILRIRKG